MAWGFSSARNGGHAGEGSARSVGSDRCQIAAALKAHFYFAHPYSAWERGTNENTNGLLRQYFPNRNFATTTEEELKIAMDRLNTRPRKCLGFKSPLEVFGHSVALTS